MVHHPTFHSDNQLANYSILCVWGGGAKVVKPLGDPWFSVYFKGCYHHTVFFWGDRFAVSHFELQGCWGGYAFLLVDYLAWHFVRSALHSCSSIMAALAIKPAVNPSFLASRCAQQGWNADQSATILYSKHPPSCCTSSASLHPLHPASWTLLWLGACTIPS